MNAYLLPRLTCAAIVVMTIASCSKQSSDFDRAIRQFVHQLQKANRELDVGSHETILIKCPLDADVLILPAYLPKSDIQRVLAGENPELIDRVFTLSRSDVSAPALLWIQNGSIVAVRKFNPGLGMDLAPLKLRARNLTAAVVVEKHQTDLELRLNESEL